MEKSLTEIKESGIFHKMKNFFMNLFKKKEETIIVEEKLAPVIEKKSKSLVEEISGKSSEELDLLELQKKYKAGEIKEEEMTKEQVDALCDLYDKQNEELQRQIEQKEKKILEYRKNLKVS